MAYHVMNEDEVKALGDELFVSNFKTISEFATKPTPAARLF